MAAGLLAIVLISLGAFFAWRIIQEKINPGSEVYELQLDESFGLQPDASVLINGVSVGRVEELDLAKEGNEVKAVMRIKPEYVHRITNGTTAEVDIPPLLGSTSIKLFPGPQSAGQLEPGSSIHAVIPEGIVNRISALMEEINKDPERNVAVYLNNLLQKSDILMDEMIKTMQRLPPILDKTSEIMTAVEPSIKNIEETTGELPAMLEEMRAVLKNANLITNDIKQISGSVTDVSELSKDSIKELTKLQEKLAVLFDNLNDMTANVSSITKKVDQGEGTVGKLINDDSLYNAADHVEQIVGKVNAGNGTLGKLINDPALYDSSVEAIEKAGDLVESISGTKTYVGAKTAYSGSQETLTTKITLKVAPRPTRYFLVGAAIISPSENGPITYDPESSVQLGPIVQVAQRLYDKKVTVRGGFIEGKIGAGVDLRLTRNTWFTFEMRDVFAEKKYDENQTQGLARAKLSYYFKNFFFVEGGVDNIFHEPSYTLGGGVEYLDEDIMKLVGLVSAGK